MGFFKNEDKPCPICGEPTAKLFAMKVEGQPICGKCKDQIYMDKDKEKNLTIDQLREHLDYRRQNEQIRNNMNVSRKINLEDALVRIDKLCVDLNKRLWYIEKGDNPPVFSFDEIMEFVYREDERIIYRINRTGIEKGTSVVESIQIANGITRAFGMNRNQNNMGRQEDYRPIRRFNLEFRLNNRYVTHMELEYTGPEMDENARSSYIRKYNQIRSRYDEAANTISVMLNQNGTVNQPAMMNQNAGQPAQDPVTEIKRYKELLDSGIITEEEFNEKKRQLMGI